MAITQTLSSFSLSAKNAARARLRKSFIKKKVPATYGDFIIFFKKKKQILKIEVGFFST